MSGPPYLVLVERVEAPKWDNAERRELRSILHSKLFLRAMHDLSKDFEAMQDGLLNISPFTLEGQRQIADVQAQVRAFFGLIDSLLALATPREEENTDAS